jgi:hypothetical protein
MGERLGVRIIERPGSGDPGADEFGSVLEDDRRPIYICVICFTAYTLEPTVGEL